MRCPYCGQEHPSAARFCPNTGQKLSMSTYCPSCGSQIGVGWSFCPNCGHRAGRTPGRMLPAVQPSRGSRPIVKGVLLGVALVAIGLLVFLLLDPFQLHLLGRLSGRYDAAATVMPPGTDLYLGIDLLPVLSTGPDGLERLSILALPLGFFGDLADVLPPSAGRGGSQADLSSAILGQLNTQIVSQLGIKLPDDLTPWIGQYAGIGVLDLADSGGESSNPKIILAIEARSTGAADQFLEKLRQGLIERQGARLSQVEYEGVQVSVLEDQSGSSPLAFGRSDRMVLFALGEGAIQEAINARRGASLANEPTYAELAGYRSSGGWVNLYLPGRWVRDALRASGGSSGASLTQILSIVSPTFAGWQGSLISASLTDAGIQIDVYSLYDLEKLPPDGREMLAATGGAHQAVLLLPEDTLAFVAGQHLDLMWRNLVAVVAREMRQPPDQLLQTLQGSQTTLGFDPDKEFFALLNKDWALAIIPATDGSIFGSRSLAPGFIFLVGTSESDMLNRTLEKLNRQIAGNVIQIPVNGGLIYELGGNRNTGLSLAYGVGKGYLAVASNGRVIERAFEGQSSLSQSGRYERLWESFPGGMSPTFYVDVQGLTQLGLLPGTGNLGETIQYLDRVQSIGGATARLGEHITRSTFFIQIRSD